MKKLIKEITVVVATLMIASFSNAQYNAPTPKDSTTAGNNKNSAALDSLARVLSTLLVGSFSNVQNNSPTSKGSNAADSSKSQVAKVLSADSLASGNYKNILSSFYKLAVNNLTGPNKDFGFTSNPYAIMLKHDSSLARYDKYYKKRHWRNLNFGIDAKLDSNYHFNGMSAGITYAIINKRDYTISSTFILDALKDSVFKQWDSCLFRLQIAVGDTVSLTDNVLRAKIDTQLNSLSNDTTFTLNKLYPEVKAWILKQFEDTLRFKAPNVKKLIELSPKLSPLMIVRGRYDSLKNTFQDKPLWVVGISDTSYSDGGLSKNIQFSTEFLTKLKWLSKKAESSGPGSSSLDLDIKATVNFLDDTLIAGKNLKRGIFSFEPGVNWVIKDKNNQKSFLEFKATGQYTRLFTRDTYAKENRDMFTLNGTINIRIINDIWIPLQFKYDPKTGNVFGFLNVTANFTGLSKLF